MAMTRSAARAHASTARRSGRYAARFNLAREGSDPPNSSRPCGLSTSGTVARRARRANPRTLAPKPWTRSTAPAVARSHATRPARSPNSGYAVCGRGGRAAPAGERERAIGHESDGRRRRATSASGFVALSAGLVMSVTSMPACGKVADEIVDAALEPAQPMQRIHRPRDDGNAERPGHRFAPVSSP